MTVLLALLVRVQVLALFHPHALTVTTPKGPLHVRAVGDTIHEGVGPPLPFLKLPALPAKAKPYAIQLERERGQKSPAMRRTFSGALEFHAHAGELAIVDELPLEEYVASVVGAELPQGPLEAQKALAVVARSFAARAVQRGESIDAHPDAPLCDSTHCQLFEGPKSATASARAAVRATENIILQLPSGSPAPALHHAACGGHTSSARELWLDPSADDEAASIAVDDHLPGGAPACAAKKGEPPLEWHAEISEAEMAKALGASLPLSLQIERDAGGRVHSLAANGGRPIGADALHLALGRALGWNRIRSSRIYLRDHADTSQHAHPQVSGSPARFSISGSGFGHGAGLCQRGAAAWARAGQDYRAILQRYFPKLSVARLPLTPDSG